MGDDDYDDFVVRGRPDLTLMAERLRGALRRIAALEKKMQEIDALLNKGLGAIALVTGIGIIISWLLSVGSNVFHLFR